MPPYVKKGDDEPRPDRTMVTVAFPWLQYQGLRESRVEELPEAVPPQPVFAYLPGSS